MTILNIETSTNVCSVAISHNNEIIWNKESYEGPAHSTLLGIFVNESFHFLKENNIQLDAVAISKGPGSYTGLRIGVSMAKGICFAQEIPLIAIDTLQIIAMAAQMAGAKTELLCPMIDARRMEVYCETFDKNLNAITPISAEIIDENSFKDINKSIAFFGNGAAKVSTTIQNPNAIFLENIHPLAKNMMTFAEKAFNEKQFEDVAYFEPFYLKEFITTTPKHKVL